MEKLGKIFEGDTKNRYKTEDVDVEIVEYLDVLVDKDKMEVLQKARITNKMTNGIFFLLEKNGIPTHLIAEINDREAAIKKSNPFPFFIKIRNYSSGAFMQRAEMDEGVKLKTPVLEFIRKTKEFGERMINGYYVLALDYATQAEMDKMVSLAFRVNEILIDFFGRLNMDLIDLKLEFGRHKGELVLIDEISPETCRLWDKNNHERLDADRFRLGLGNVAEAYREMARRLNIPLM